MATAHVNGVRLFYEVRGRREIPLFLVHGSWGSHHSWDAVVSRLAESFEVVTYDRRGHSQSERVTGRGSIREDVADLAALIEELNLAPAWVAGSSFGGSIALRLACERRDLLRGVVAHEPPLLRLLEEESDYVPFLEEVQRRTSDVLALVLAGDHPGAAEQFVETLALGPGTWARLPSRAQQTFVENASTFVDEASDPDQMSFDLSSLERFSRPVLLTLGDQSPSGYIPVVEKLAAALPEASVTIYPGAGHIPHSTNPDSYSATVTAFIKGHEQ
ncbi:MAG: alpha/beta hydrolase [Actinomycetota bacterium]|nr:alpha/beta hydrolase [Actinomycetota bacterium]